MSADLLVPLVRRSALHRLTAAHPSAVFVSIAFLTAYPLLSVVALVQRGLLPDAGC